MNKLTVKNRDIPTEVSHTINHPYSEIEKLWNDFTNGNKKWIVDRGDMYVWKEDYNSQLTNMEIGQATEKEYRYYKMLKKLRDFLLEDYLEVEDEVMK